MVKDLKKVLGLFLWGLKALGGLGLSLDIGMEVSYFDGWSHH